MKKHLWKLFRQFSFGLVLSSPVGLTAAESPDIALVTALPRSETQTGVLHHADSLWVSVSSEVHGKFGTVEVFDKNGVSRLASLDLGHSANYIYPYSSNAVLVVGKSFWPWKSHATVVNKVGNKFSKKTITFSEKYLVDSFAGDSQQLFFNEPGNAAVYQFKNGRMKEIISEVSGPNAMVLAGSKLWLIERRTAPIGDESLIVYDTATATMQRIFNDSFRLGLDQIAYNPITNLVAVTESGNNTVIFLDASTGKVVDEVGTYEYPRGIIAYGSCFAVVGEENKLVTFFARKDKQSVEVGSWDLSKAGEMLKKPRYLSADSATGDLYVRSAFPCPSCVPNTQSSVFRVRDSGKKVVKECLN